MHTEHPVSAWSFSRLQIYEQCPARAWYAYGAKIPEPPVPDDHPRNRGTRIHSEAEHWVRSNGEGPLPASLRKFSEDFETLAELHEKGVLTLEEKWAFTRNWEPTGFFDDNAWARIVLDLVHHASPTHIHAVDYKSGKRWGNEVPHTQQLQLYSIPLFILNPELETARLEDWYIDHGIKHGIDITRQTAETLKASFTNRALNFTTTTHYPPKANKRNCRFCPYKPSELNVCPHGVDP